MRFFLLGLLLLPALVAAEFDPKTHPVDAPLPARNALRGTLANGLEYVVDARSGEHLEDEAVVYVVVEVGAVHEAEAEVGFTHFIEHLGFRATSRHDDEDVKEFLTKMNVSGLFHAQNAFTGLEQTQYFVSIPEKPNRHIEDTLDLLAARVFEPIISAEHVAAERPVIRSEEITRRSLPAQHQRFEAMLGKGHPYLNPARLSPDSIDATTVEGLRAFHTKWFRPERAMVAVVGDLNAKRAVRLIKKIFGRYQNPGSPNPPEIALDPPSGEVAIEIRDETARLPSVQVWNVQRVQPSTTIGEMRPWLSAYLGRVIAAQKLAAFATETETVIAAGYGQQNLSKLAMNTFSVVAAPGTEHVNFNAAVKVMEEVLRSGINPESVRTAIDVQRQQLQSFVEQADKRTHAQMAELWIASLAEGRALNSAVDEVAAINHVYDQITPEDVYVYWRQSLTEGREALVLTLPEGVDPAEPLDAFTAALGAFDKRVAPTALDGETVAGVDERFVLKGLEPGGIRRETHHAVHDIFEWELENGALVLYKQDSEENARVQIFGTAPGGAAILDDMDEERLSAARDILFASGLRGLQGPDLANYFNLQRTSARFEIGAHDHGVRVSSVPEHIDFAFRALHLVATEGSVDPRMFASVLASKRVGFEASAATPLNRFRQAFSDVLWSGRRVGNSIFDSARLDGLSAEWIVELYERLFGSVDGMHFLITAPLPAAEIKPLVARYVASLRGGRRHEHGEVTTEPAQRSQSVRFLENPNDRSDVTWVYLHKDAGFEPRDMFIRQLYTALLNERLQKRARLEEALLYSISAGSRGNAYPVPHASIGIQFVATPANVAAVEAVVEGVIKSLPDEDFADELDVLRHERLRGFDEYFDKAWNVLWRFHSDRRAGLPVQDIGSVKKILGSIKSANVQTYARKVRDEFPLVVGEFAPVPAPN